MSTNIPIATCQACGVEIRILHPRAGDILFLQDLPTCRSCILEALIVLDRDRILDYLYPKEGS